MNLFKDKYSKIKIFNSNNYIDNNLYLTTIKLDFLILFLKNKTVNDNLLQKIQKKLEHIKDERLRKWFYELILRVITWDEKYATDLYNYLSLWEFKSSFLYQLYTRWFKSRTTSKHYYLALIEWDNQKVYKLYDWIWNNKEIIEENIKRNLYLIKKPLIYIRKDWKYVSYSWIDDINLNAKNIYYKINLWDIVKYDVIIFSKEKKIKINNKSFDLNSNNIFVNPNTNEYKFAMWEHKKWVYPFHFLTLRKIEEMLLKIFSYEIINNIFSTSTNQQNEKSLISLKDVMWTIQNKLTSVVKDIINNITLKWWDINTIKYIKEYNLLTNEDAIKNKTPIDFKKNLMKIYIILQYYVWDLTYWQVEFKNDEDIKVIEDTENIKKFIFTKQDQKYEITIDKNRIINYLEIAYIDNWKFVREFYNIIDYSVISLYWTKLKINLEKYKHLELKVDEENVILAVKNKSVKDDINKYIQYLKTKRNNIKYKELAQIVWDKELLKTLIKYTYAINTRIWDQFIAKIKKLLKEDKKDAVLIWVRYDDKINLKYNTKYFLIKARVKDNKRKLTLYLTDIINKPKLNANISNYIVSTLNLKLKDNLTLILPEEYKFSYTDFINEMKETQNSARQNIVVERSNSYLIYSYKNWLIYKIFTSKDYFNIKWHKEFINKKYKNLLTNKNNFYLTYDLLNKLINT